MAEPAQNINQYTLMAGWRYSSGTLHAAHDYAMVRGTPLFAVGDGVIGERFDGVANHPAGSENNPGSGAPSNYVLLWTTWRGKNISVYYQHMSPGLNVKTGERVKEGQRLGESGNTGNSTGDHLHIAAFWGHSTNQYQYMTDLSTCIFPPSKVWELRKDEDVTKEEIEAISDLAARKVLRTQLWPNAPKGDTRHEVTVAEALRRSYLGHDQTTEI